MREGNREARQLEEENGKGLLWQESEQMQVKAKESLIPKMRKQEKLSFHQQEAQVFLTLN